MARGLTVRLFLISPLFLMKGHMTSPRSHTLIEQNIFFQVNKKGPYELELLLWRWPYGRANWLSTALAQTESKSLILGHGHA